MLLKKFGEFFSISGKPMYKCNLDVIVYFQILKELDLADLNSVRKFAYSVREEFPEIHLLVNNAGVYFDCDMRQVTKDGFEIHMGVNHLGHFLLTNLLLDNLKRAAPSRYDGQMMAQISYKSYKILSEIEGI
jgi:NAD(P)-dependent dehydrogenase (short-subunit alcohol dehydrogenase family)